MLLQIILSIILVRYLHGSLKKTGQLSSWKVILIVGTILPIVLIVIEASVKESRQIVSWIAHLQLLGIIFTIFFNKELRFAKPVLYAVLPLIIINYISDIVVLIDKRFYKNWETYFKAAEFFTVVWLVAMLLINRKQRRTLEKERLKAVEKEKEYQITASLKAALELQVTERTAALTLQTVELQRALDELKSTQVQLIQSEKMASLGELTAGIAHEIQNPLNFVNNFSEVSNELIDEMNTEIQKGDFEEAKLIANDIKQNLEKINHHGKRADAIVKGMLQHSRSSSGIKEPTDVNKLADEYLRLAYHGLRAKDKTFNALMKTDFDPGLSANEAGLGAINVIPQDIGRVVLNLITNAFYAVAQKKKLLAVADPSVVYEPTVFVSTKNNGDTIEITVGDNGAGIPSSAIDKIFQPFFTTKPTGEGTGLGLSMSYDIVTKGHGGQLKVKTKTADEVLQEESGTSFTIILPK